MAATLAFLEGTTALESVEPRAGRPIQPMQAVPVDDLEEALFDATCVEWAPRGLRLQAHRAGRTVSLFVHDGMTSIDVTDRLPAVVEMVQAMPGDDLVLDGELGEMDMPDPSDAGAGRSVRFFDLLFDGDALLDRPLARRRSALDVVVPSELRMPSIETSDPDEVRRFLDEAQARGRSGVVLKDLGSVYEPGRGRRTWRLLAPVQTLDLVVVAAEWGSGRRSDKLSRVHLAARTATGAFETVGRTALGITDEMLKWQTERLLQLAVDDDEDRSGGLVTVRPEQVVEVTFDSVHESERSGRAVSLRSARVRRYRDDKRAFESDTIETLRALVQADERDEAPPPSGVEGLRRRADDAPAVPGNDNEPRLPPARPPGLDAAQAEAAKRIREVLADRESSGPAVAEPALGPATPPRPACPCRVTSADTSHRSTWTSPRTRNRSSTPGVPRTYSDAGALHDARVGGRHHDGCPDHPIRTGAVDPSLVETIGSGRDSDRHCAGGHRLGVVGPADPQPQAARRTSAVAAEMCDGMAVAPRRVRAARSDGGPALPDRCGRCASVDHRRHLRGGHVASVRSGPADPRDTDPHPVRRTARRWLRARSRGVRAAVVATHRVVERFGGDDARRRRDHDRHRRRGLGGARRQRRRLAWDRPCRRSRRGASRCLATHPIRAPDAPAPRCRPDRPRGVVGLGAAPSRRAAGGGGTCSRARGCDHR